MTFSSSTVVVERLSARYTHVASSFCVAATVFSGVGRVCPGSQVRASLVLYERESKINNGPSIPSGCATTSIDEIVHTYLYRIVTTKLMFARSIERMQRTTGSTLPIDDIYGERKIVRQNL